MRWLAIVASSLLLVSCYLPWIYIHDPYVFISGFKASVDTFGKPGIVHVFLGAVIILMMLVDKGWALRIAFFLSAFNIAWACRNYFLIGSCRSGICPERQPALYFILWGSFLQNGATPVMRLLNQPKIKRQMSVTVTE